MYVSVWGGCIVVATAGHPPTKVSGQPAYRVVSECCLCEGSDECSVVDHVECLRKVYRHGQCAMRQPWPIKARGYCVCEGKECCGGVMSLPESMLCWGDREGVCEFGEEKAFEHFH